MSHALVEAGEYLWLPDQQTGQAFPSTSDSLVSGARRINFSNGEGDRRLVRPSVAGEDTGGHDRPGRAGETSGPPPGCRSSSTG